MDKPFGDDTEVTVWPSRFSTTEPPTERVPFPEGTVVRFRTASGAVDVWVHQGKLRVTSNVEPSVPGGEGKPGLTVRPRSKTVLEIVPGL